MNERYLFRGKRKDNGEWIKGDLVHSQTTTRGIITEIYTLDMAYEVIPETVGQLTGLKDKNGKLIFEGDILKDSLGVISVVEWCADGRFLGFAIKNDTSCHWHGGRQITYIAREPSVEVIGNIHDNPELLEVER